jgi:hypothetical protein
MKVEVGNGTYDIGGLELDVARQPIRDFDAKVAAT